MRRLEHGARTESSSSNGPRDAGSPACTKMNEPSAPSGGHTPSSPSAATPHPTGLSHWFAELKRRRVFRALVAYGIAAFAVLQIIEPIMHGLRWPETVLSYVVAALAAGFPVVIA